jgi:hypothetical protein
MLVYQRVTYFPKKFMLIPSIQARHAARLRCELESAMVSMEKGDDLGGFGMWKFMNFQNRLTKRLGISAKEIDIIYIYITIMYPTI